MKRFTETKKWVDPWFQDLPIKYKVFWSYLTENCDVAGVWKANLRLASFQLGEPFEASEVLRVFHGRVEDIGGGEWWLTTFCDFQYGTLSPDCRPHEKIIKELSAKNLIHRVSNTLPERVSDTLQEEDKEEEEDKDKETEEPIPFPKQGSEAKERLNRLFNRRPETKWSDKELSAFRKLLPIDLAELARVEAYTERQRAKGKDGIHRRDLYTFLNNYRGEVDRANVPVASATAHKSAI